ncbi:subtilisin-like serine protease PR1C [Myriangium duriaei CBS 260.36]|uniref:Subtilisin-like serine protease PR1C n=1 Tax=Myriangium duriaei CBS 260.36 TaxID=1168546 RepID=A0A9P4MGK9_9PEZI|nr:subtilisin-like serine protease PR1C [Myriangium duriaei CBS 260.36]
MGVLRFLSLATALLSPIAIAAKPEAAPKVPGAYIVEFADTHDVDGFYAKLGAAGQAVEHRMDLKYDLFKGVSFRLKDTEDEETAAKKIEELPEVKKIWPVRTFPVPRDQVIWRGDSRTPMPSSALYKRQDGGNATDNFSTHVMTQVDRLRADGIRGKGIKIAVIDTGTDYKHPALGGCFGPGCLVSFGRDLVGDGYNGQNIPVPDADPYDNCEGHGTHVAGIIAAQTNPYGFTGAAPDVTLGSYRVFGCGGSAGNDVLIAAYNQAYQDGAQIITASIGGPSGWSEEPWSVAVSRIVEAGVPCTVSAGNDGSFGLFYASTAANGKRVTSIASVDNTQAPVVLLNATYTVSNGTNSFGWTQGSPSAWGNISLPLWSVNYNTSDDANACTALPDDTPDLSRYIVLVRRGGCTFVQKVTNLAAKGAKYIMFYNNADGASAVTAVVPGVVAVGMTTADTGAKWISLLAGGANVTVNIVDPHSAAQFAQSGPNTATAGFLSTFTSWGPTYEVDAKQQYSSPGGIILSTYPLALGGYAVLSGTSMACPLAAAITALVAEVRGTFDPATLENALSATANPNLFNNGKQTFPYLASTAQQGAGLIQAYDAAHATTLLSVSSLSFNDTANFDDTKNFTITNTGSEEVSFSLSHVPAGTFYTLATGNIVPQVFPNEYAAATASIDFADKEISVPAGGSAVVSLSADLPVGLEATRLPVYSGYIALNGTDGSSFSLPYIGVAGSLSDATVLDTNNTYLALSTDTSTTPAPIAAGRTFTLPANNGTAGNGTVYPELVLNLALGTALLRIDVRPIESYGSYTNATEVLGVRTVGNIYGYPAEYLARGAQTVAWKGLLADGNPAPAGTYELVVRALRIFGDRENAEEYDEAVSVSFDIKYA